MSNRVESWGIFGVMAVVSAGGGCEVIQGLQPATVNETGGGGQGGGTGGTTSSGGDTGGTGGTPSTGGTGGAGTCEPGTSIDCYTGMPATTNGTAKCHGGTRACKADGSGYEDACAGEVTPQPETCASTDDEDCDTLDCVRWAGIYGDGNEQKPLDIKVDGAGNVYVLGAFKGSIKLSNPAKISAGEYDLFLVKLDPSGNVLWDKQFGDAADQQSGQLAVDVDGNVAMAGKLTGTLDFGGASLQGKDLFVAKLDPAGGHLWSKALLAGSATTPHIAAGFDGSVVMWTSFLGSANFGSGPLTADPDYKSVLTSLSGETGNPAWLKVFVSTGAQSLPGTAHNHTFATSLDVDSSGNISVNGSFGGKKLNLGGSDIQEVASGYGGAFLARFDKLGSHAWSVGQSVGQPVSGELSADPVGAVVLSLTDDSEGFAPCVSGALTKCDNVGAKLWGKLYSCAGQGNEYDFKSIHSATDPQENVVLAVVPPDDVFNFDGNMLPGKGGMDIVLGKLDPDGNHLWSRRFGDAADQRYPLVATAPNGDIVMAAQVSGTIDVGTGALVTNGQDLLIARFAP